MRQARSLAGHLQVALNDAVMRREVGVGDRPVLADAVATCRLELVVGHPQRPARPSMEAPADLPPPNPMERCIVRAEVRILEIVDE